MYLLLLSTIAAILATTTYAIATPNQPIDASTPDQNFPPSHDPSDPRFAPNPNPSDFIQPVPITSLRSLTPWPSPTSISTNTTNTKRELQGVYGLYECDNQYFKGNCFWHQIDPYNVVCQNAKYSPGGGPPYMGGSFGPDKGVYCHIFEGYDCFTYPGFDIYGITYPGTGDCINYEPFHPKAGAFWECPYSWKCAVDVTEAWKEDNGVQASGVGGVGGAVLGLGAGSASVPSATPDAAVKKPNKQDQALGLTG